MRKLWENISFMWNFWEISVPSNLRSISPLSHKSKKKLTTMVIDNHYKLTVNFFGGKILLTYHIGYVTINGPLRINDIPSSTNCSIVESRSVPKWPSSEIVNLPVGLTIRLLGNASHFCNWEPSHIIYLYFVATLTGKYACPINCVSSWLSESKYRILEFMVTRYYKYFFSKN